MKIRYSILKSLISSACLISIGGQSLVSHAMEYNEILESTKDNHYCLNSISKESIEYMKGKGYTIQKFLGSGHSGLVFLAKDSEEHQYVLKFTESDLGEQIFPQHYNVCDINELPEKYRGFFKNTYTTFVSPTGDCLLYDNLKENSIVDLGKNACKIYGYEKTEKVGKYYKLCIILEYIDGPTLRDYASTTEYNTYQVRDWLKGICNSLKTMYQKDFLHLSIGIGNIKIRKSDNSAVLYDYERANYKGLIEALRKIRQENYNKSLYDDLNDERGRKFSAVPPHENGEYYDLHCLCQLIDDIMKQGNKYDSFTASCKYKRTSPRLHYKILKLKEVNTLEDFLTGVDKL